MNNTIYKPQKEEVKSEFSSGKALRESDSRIIVGRKLREAGWDIEDKNQVTTEESVKDGRADYLLLDREKNKMK